MRVIITDELQLGGVPAREQKSMTSMGPWPYLSMWKSTSPNRESVSANSSAPPPNPIATARSLTGIVGQNCVTPRGRGMGKDGRREEDLGLHRIRRGQGDCKTADGGRAKMREKREDGKGGGKGVTEVSYESNGATQREGNSAQHAPSECRSLVRHPYL
jgi:hypothetical protein